jgi:hypothetical protein
MHVTSYSAKQTDSLSKASLELELYALHCVNGALFSPHIYTNSFFDLETRDK